MADEPTVAADEQPPAPTSADAQAARAAEDAEVTKDFIDKLEAEAEVRKVEYMSARIPAHMREAFEERYPTPEPDAPTAAFIAAGGTQDTRTGKQIENVQQTLPVNTSPTNPANQEPVNTENPV